MEVNTKIIKTIYRNDINSFSVISVALNGKVVTVVGYFPLFTEGEQVQFSGEYIKNKYGYQFSANDFKVIIPSEEQDIIDFLSSGIIKGIGLSTAKLIVEKFGKDTLDVLSNTPFRLTEIKGIGEYKASMISNSYSEIISSRKILFELQKLGFTTKEAIKISDFYGENALKVLKENPYSLIEDIDGIGFITADKIAIKIGFSLDSDYRIRSALIYQLNDLSNVFGHTCYPKNLLIKEVSSLIDVDEILIEVQINKMLLTADLKAKIIENEYYIALPYYYNIEKEISVYLHKRLETVSKSDLEIDNIETVFSLNPVKLDEKQKEAISLTINNNISIITGGPGTGKTTVINFLLKIYEGKKICLCAPTGRAAKRITEGTGQEASTIHKLLEYGFDTNGFNKDESNQLECDIIIVDEMSMVDSYLFCSLLRAIPFSTKIVLIGDVDQLPSVGAGNLLYDMIYSHKIPCSELKKIYRQKEESTIITNSARIRNGQFPKLNKKNSDFFFIETKSAPKIQDLIINLYTERLPQFLKINKNNKENIFNNIQILSPVKKGDCGAYELNKLIQIIYKNPLSKNEFVFAGQSYFIGDKVIQTKNDYNMEYKYEDSTKIEKGIFNGEIGRIVEIDDKEVIIRFEDNKIARYSSLDMDNITLAYCLTVHKSQGSEFPVVIMPVMYGSRLLYTRNLLYTAITRAKKLVILVGERQALDSMINNNYIAKRYTLLLDNLIHL